MAVTCSMITRTCFDLLGSTPKLCLGAIPLCKLVAYTNCHEIIYANSSPLPPPTSMADWLMHSLRVASCS